MSRGRFSVQRASLSKGSLFMGSLSKGFSVQRGSLSRGSLSREVLCPMGSLSRGSLSGGLCPGGVLPSSREVDRLTHSYENITFLAVITNVMIFFNKWKCTLQNKRYKKGLLGTMYWSKKSQWPYSCKEEIHSRNRLKSGNVCILLLWKIKFLSGL